MLVDEANQLRHPSDGNAVFIGRVALHVEVLFCFPQAGKCRRQSCASRLSFTTF